MATSQSPISLASHDTALCIIPPRERWSSVERLRALHDKAYEKWPPHVNLIYPFVQQDVLASTAARFQDHLAADASSSSDRRTVHLDKAGVFQHKHNNTLYLHDADTTRISWLQELRDQVLTALGHPKQANDGYQMHMTIAQSEDAASSSHRFLLDKVALLPALEWDVTELAILVRERQQQNGGVASHMKLWGVINLSDPARSSLPLSNPVLFYEPSPNMDGIETDEYPTTFYDDETDLWLPFDFPPSSTPRTGPRNLSVSSYNILAEFHHPFTTLRNPLTISTLLSTPALSSILILQEVTDSSLAAILADAKIRAQYPFASHGPPVQPDVDPLPNHLNIVVLSKYPFAWEHVSLRRKHKDAIIARFYLTDDPGQRGPEPDLVVAGVHLPHGMTDGAAVARRLDLQILLRFLDKKYEYIPCVLAGDFNLETAGAAIDEAMEKGSLSSNGRGYINGFDEMMAERGFVDTWEVMKDTLTVADEHEDDEGATFDPTRNEAAAAAAGGSGSAMLPHRYDRIFIRGEGRVELKGFNRFGFLKGMVGDVETLASDHWGVRCLMTIGGEISQEVGKLVVPIELVEAPQALSSAEGIIDALALPTPEEEAARNAAIRLVKNVILAVPDSHVSASSKPIVAVAPVGSFPLGVWTTSSDLDVMFIGPYSSQTFLALATQAIRKAASPDVKLLRRVKANTGTMLELEVLGIKMDLQYCTATDVARNWPQVLTVPATNPVWTLPMQTLLKLKAARDLDYIRRSVPDLAAFRHAHRFIKAWAKAHGVYSARFGFLGGIQISILLARAQKLLAASSKTPPSLPDLITTFFSHYSAFPFATHSVFDPFFHATSLPHHRSTVREPLAILGYFPPALNTTAAASVPSTRTLTHELARAASALTKSTSWSELLSPATAATSFLTSYKSYARLSVQYWGQSPTRGRQFIGWLESRCVSLLVDMHRRAPGIHARVWPARFVDPDANTAPEDTNDYQGCYLIGLERVGAATTKEDMQTALGGLRSALHRFEETMRADEKYFDSRTCWLGAEVVSRGDLGALVLDRREWGEFAAGEDESEEEEEEDDSEENDDDHGSLERDLSSAKKKAKKKAKDAAAPAVVPGAGKKLRSATDVLNRLRWDPDLDSTDFVVGYEDRFLGAQEKALEAWRTEKTDEEFIPQHRILYYKRRSDGVVVWDRGARKDVLFGSGVDAEA